MAATPNRLARSARPAIAAAAAWPLAGYAIAFAHAAIWLSGHPIPRWVSWQGQAIPLLLTGSTILQARMAGKPFFQVEGITPPIILMIGLLIFVMYLFVRYGATHPLFLNASIDGMLATCLVAEAVRRSYRTVRSRDF